MQQRRFKNHKTMNKSIHFLLLCIFLSVNAQSQTASFKPDRPGNSPRPVKLDKGVFNIAGGFLFENTTLDDRSPQSSLQDISISLRYGLLENMEVYLRSTYRSLFLHSYIPSTKKISGLSPISIGSRVMIAKERGIYPHIELQGELLLPYLGKEDFTPRDVEPSFAFSFLHTLSENTILTYGLGMYWTGPDERGLLGAMLTRSLKPRHGIFGETYAFLKGHGAGEVYLGAGYFFLLRPTLQLDVSLQYGGGKDSRTFGLSLGFSTDLKSPRD